eukprot:COSAG02_NODE_641_length_19049_cov_119.025541_5_plen_183_part_00
MRTPAATRVRHQHEHNILVVMLKKLGKVGMAMWATGDTGRMVLVVVVLVNMLNMMVVLCSPGRPAGGYLLIGALLVWLAALLYTIVEENNASNSSNNNATYSTCHDHVLMYSTRSPRLADDGPSMQNKCQKRPCPVVLHSLPTLSERPWLRVVRCAGSQLRGRKPTNSTHQSGASISHLANI